MKRHVVLIAISLAGFAGAAAAAQARIIMQPPQTIELLSAATGLTTGEVELALGPSANYEYPVRYASANRRFRQAVGRTIYEQMIREGELNAPQVQALTAMAHDRAAKVAIGK